MKFFAYVYLFLVCAYITWGTFTAQGLPGWFLTQMMKQVGWASTELVGGLLVILAVTPVAPFLRKAEQETKSPASMALLFLLLIIGPTVLGFWGRQHLKSTDAEEQTLILEEVDLSQSSLALSKEKHLLRLSGVCRLESGQLVVQEQYGKEHTLYIPVTGTSQEKSIAHVLVLRGGSNVPGAIPAAQGRSFIPLHEKVPTPAQLDVLAEPGALPAYVREAWIRQGLNVADEVFLLESKFLVNGKLPSSVGAFEADLALYLGLGASFIIFLGVAAGLLIRKFRNRS